MQRNVTWFTLAVVAFVGGFLCLFFSFFLPSHSPMFTVTLALGISLLPTGMISIITSVASSSIIERRIRERMEDIDNRVRSGLEESGRTLRLSIDDLRVASEYLSTSKQLGLSMVHRDRATALQMFLTHLEQYVQRGPDSGKKEIIVVGSSLKGVIEDDPAFASQLERILSHCHNGCQCRFLLTHPAFSSFREAQEDRPPGGIAKEILHAIAWLEEKGVPQANIRVYKGTPTCFMIASTDRMLINPYPYEREAYRIFCLELENIGSEKSIYYSFWANHFYKPWYGEEKRKDHFITPNSLSYLHDSLDGPIPGSVATGSGETFGDFFVINDKGTFYLAVNIRGLASELPYDRKADGTCKVVRVGKILTIKLLDLSSDELTWVSIGNIELSDVRNGFWHGTPQQTKAFEVYSMIGLFDDDNPSPFPCEEVGSALKGSAMPLMWKWLTGDSSS